MPGRIRVFIACSLDGFIAGLDDDLSWLPKPEGADDFGYGAFIADVGALLMGRRTYDVVAGFPEWSYGNLPVLVATQKPLASPHATVRPVAGSIDEVVRAAREAAGERDVYIDGGNLIRQAVDAGLVDELTITVVPVVLGRGLPLLAGTERRHALERVDVRTQKAGLVQLVYRPKA